MLELIGLIALIILAIKFLPDILSFAFKVIVVLLAVWLLLHVVSWIFTWPILPLIIIM